MNPFIFAVSAPLALFHSRSVSCRAAAMDKDAIGRHAKKKAGWEAEQNRAALLSLLTDSDSCLVAVGSHSLRFPDPSSLSQQHV